MAIPYWLVFLTDGDLFDAVFDGIELWTCDGLGGAAFEAPDSARPLCFVLRGKYQGRHNYLIQTNPFVVFLIFIRFGILGWIRGGDTTQNALTTSRFSFFSVVFCFTETCKEYLRII